MAFSVDEWPYTVETTQRMLHWIGFGDSVGVIDGVLGERTSLALQRFQEGWTFDALDVTGDLDDDTWAALHACVAAHGRCSEHFFFAEFRSPDTGEVRVLRSLVAGLERLRAHTREPLLVLSGYRTEDHNQRVGGATRSFHLLGAAADILPRVSYYEVAELQAFSGIGFHPDNDLVIHVDVRHDTLWRDGSTPEDPVIFSE
jgi:hypothetical protein